MKKGSQFLKLTRQFVEILSGHLRFGFFQLEFQACEFFRERFRGLLRMIRRQASNFLAQRVHVFLDGSDIDWWRGEHQLFFDLP